MKKMIAFAAALTLAACAEQPTTEDMQNADYGRVMAQAECEAVARQNILPQLKDPSSAKITFSACEKRVMHSIPIFSIPKQAGYLIVANVNARNSFGGYTGAQVWQVLMRDGEAVRRTMPSDGAQIPY